MLRLGISCYYHDSAVAIVDDSEIKFAIQEERLSRRKHDRRFPALAVAHADGIPSLTYDRRGATGGAIAVYSRIRAWGVGGR